MELKYYCILTIDITAESEKLNNYKNEIIRKLKTVEKIPEEKIIKKHRKYIGIVNANELLGILNFYGYFSTCETIGSITEFGWMNAINFSFPEFNYGIASINMYVSPIFKNIDKKLIEIKKENKNQYEIIYGKINNELNKILEKLYNLKWNEKIEIDKEINIEEIMSKYYMEI